MRGDQINTFRHLESGSARLDDEATNTFGTTRIVGARKYRVKVRDTGVGYPRFSAAQHPFVSVTPRAATHCCDIRPGLGLRQ